MSRAYHILHIVASLQGGAAIHVKHLADGLRRNGHQVSIAAPNDHPEFFQTLQNEEIPFYDIPLAQAWIPTAIVRLKPLLHHSSFTHVHVHGHRAALIARLARVFSFTRLPFIYTVHGYHPPHYARAISRFYVNALESFLLPQTDRIICVSPSCRKSLLESLPKAKEKSHVIANGIPLQSWTREEHQHLRQKGRGLFNIPQEAWVFGTVARLQWQKGVDRLLQAWGWLEPPENMYLLLVGNGPDRVRLMKMAEELGIASRCIFTGNQLNVRELYPCMDVFVLPSLWEGLPLTVLEAWDAEIPVLATDVLGNRDLIIEGKTGFLATPSAEGIYEGLERVLQLSETYSEITHAAKNELLTCYTSEKMTKKVLEIYRELEGNMSCIEE